LEAPRLWETLERVVPSRETGELYLTEAVAATRNHHGKAIAVKAAVPSDALGVNDRAQLAQVTRVLRDRINLAHMRSGVTMTDPETVYLDPRARIGRDTTILPFVVVEG